MIELKITVPSYAIIYDKAQLRKVLRAAGTEVASVARAMIRRSAGGGRTYRKPGGGSYAASAPGQPPANRTGVLVGSIKVSPFRSGDGVSIRDFQYYATILEKGFSGGGRSGGKLSSIKKAKRSGRAQRQLSATRTMAPRPFLSAALTQRSASIEARVKEAVLQGIKFQRQKA